MSIRIEIGDRYVVTSDQFQFILREKKVAKTGNNADKEYLDTVGYYPKLSQLVSGLLHHSILTGDATAFESLAVQVERVAELCQAVSPSPALSHGINQKRPSVAIDLLHVPNSVRCKRFYSKLTVCRTS